MKKITLLILPFLLYSDQPESKKPVLQDSTSLGSNIALCDSSKEVLITGKRDKLNVMRVINVNRVTLRYGFSRIIEVEGVITFRIVIAETGQVIECSVVSTTINDPPLIRAMMGKIKRWRFGPIDAPGDRTEVIYPFIIEL